MRGAVVVIPFHKREWIFSAVQSCLRQTVLPEILVVPNGGLEHDAELRAALVSLGCVWLPSSTTGNIGALKQFGCMHATGEWIIELDHDDILDPRAVERILDTADRHRDAVMLYSDCHYRAWPEPWDKAFGWKYYTDQSGRFVTSAPAPEPQNLCRIWYSPDHVRAWRRDWYRSVGGHNPALPVADDHDLTCRAWLHGPGAIRHIPECLYEYQVHPAQTTAIRNAEIQQAQWGVYEKRLEPMALEWARRNRLLALDLGGGINPRDGYIAVDRSRGAIRADLEQDWPFGDDFCGVLRMADVAEHLRNPIHTMNEAWRCLAHGGFLFMRVPSTDGRAAFRDPTHVSYWNIESFWYYTKSQYRRFIEPQCRCRFQVLRVHDIQVDGILYSEAHLIAIKDGGMRYHGLLEC